MFFLHWWKISVLNGDPCSNSWSVNHQFRDDFAEKWFSEWFCHRSPSESVSLALRTIFQQNPFRRKHRHLNTPKHKQTHKQAILQQNPLKHWHLHTCRKASLHTSFSSNASMMFLIPSERSEFFSNPLVMLRKVSCDAAKRHCLAFDIRGKKLTARFHLFAVEKIRNALDHHFQNTSQNALHLQVNCFDFPMCAHCWCYRFYSGSGDFVTIYNKIGSNYFNCTRELIEGSGSVRKSQTRRALAMHILIKCENIQTTVKWATL